MCRGAILLKASLGASQITNLRTAVIWLSFTFALSHLQQNTPAKSQYVWRHLWQYFGSQRLKLRTAALWGILRSCTMVFVAKTTRSARANRHQSLAEIDLTRVLCALRVRSWGFVVLNLQPTSLTPTQKCCLNRIVVRTLLRHSFALLKIDFAVVFDVKCEFDITICLVLIMLAVTLTPPNLIDYNKVAMAQWTGQFRQISADLLKLTCPLCYVHCELGREVLWC